MNIEPIKDNNSNFGDVKLKADSLGTCNTPHCKKHGAMNKVSIHENGGGYWRCLELSCRSGCNQLANTDWLTIRHRK